MKWIAGEIGIGQSPPPPGRIARPVWTISGESNLSRAARCVDRRIVSVKSDTGIPYSAHRFVDLFFRDPVRPSGRRGVNVIRRGIVLRLGRFLPALQFRLVHHDLRPLHSSSTLAIGVGNPAGPVLIGVAVTESAFCVSPRVTLLYARTQKRCRIPAVSPVIVLVNSPPPPKL